MGSVVLPLRQLPLRLVCCFGGNVEKLNEVFLGCFCYIWIGVSSAMKVSRLVFGVFAVFLLLVVHCLYTMQSSQVMLAPLVWQSNMIWLSMLFHLLMLIVVNCF